MKRLLIILILLSTNVMAEEVNVDLTREAGRTHVTVKSVCVQGYVFAIIASDDGSYGDRGVGIVQMFEANKKSMSPPQPMKCGVKKQ